MILIMTYFFTCFKFCKKCEKTLKHFPMVFITRLVEVLFCLTCIKVHIHRDVGITKYNQVFIITKFTAKSRQNDVSKIRNAVSLTSLKH